MPVQPKNLRVLSRQTIRELLNDDRCADAAKECRLAIKALSVKGEPWSMLLVDLLYDRFRWCSERQGDVPLWNRGGQGNRALRYLGDWRQDVADEESGEAQKCEDELKVVLALYKNGVCEHDELLDCCSPYRSAIGITDAAARLAERGLVLRHETGNGLVWYLVSKGMDRRIVEAIRRLLRRA